ncbi:hypothetical protein QN366_09415 [Pseudomonas sp. CCC3.2]|uniref:hypothetical protein n=1 Tax=unclassified Pseudomonas TaxID=196821 RepID=UPI002AB52BA9|nr:MULTISPECIES: hypothetical protein [unclassified Pseudomonas]MDY7562417.1 hypothetical protein [Pseudomonas sp. AB6]MEB0180285.1 hypothetical protein [Pseudomonas sp. CCC3.2]MEB0212376.1 hypothetical protein [Pseudomonas sp. AB6]
MLSSPNPLSIAASVLARTTIECVLRSPSYHARGWQILDRWAFNYPDRLRRLEADGEVILLGRLLEQQCIEHDVMSSDEGFEQRRHGLTEHEILTLHGVVVEL